MQVWNQPIIVVLHIAYAWLGLGLILLGVAIIWEGFMVSDAIHGLAIGAIGIMVAAMMSRASFGHSGLPMKAGWALTSVYALIGTAVFLRLGAGFFVPQIMVNLSGLLWIVAFIIFVATFMPLYFKPRQ